MSTQLPEKSTQPGKKPAPVLESSAPVPGTVPAVAVAVAVTFILPGEVQADRVALCGDFNDWSPDIDLERGADGAWRASVPLSPGRAYRYRYLLDGERWENAWQADGYAPNPYGSDDSVVVVLE